MVIGPLVDDLGHEHVECGESHNQSKHVEHGRYFEAPCHVDDIIERLSHEDSCRIAQKSSTNIEMKQSVVKFISRKNEGLAQKMDFLSNYLTLWRFILVKTARWTSIPKKKKLNVKFVLKSL